MPINDVSSQIASWQSGKIGSICAYLQRGMANAAEENFRLRVGAFKVIKIQIGECPVISAHQNIQNKFFRPNFSKQIAGGQIVIEIECFETSFDWNELEMKIKSNENPWNFERIICQIKLHWSIKRILNHLKRFSPDQRSDIDPFRFGFYY